MLTYPDRFYDGLTTCFQRVFNRMLNWVDLKEISAVWCVIRNYWSQICITPLYEVMYCNSQSQCHHATFNRHYSLDPVIVRPAAIMTPICTPIPCHWLFAHLTLASSLPRLAMRKQAIQKEIMIMITPRTAIMFFGSVAVTTTVLNHIPCAQ